jgi:hypothetical protein
MIKLVLFFNNQSNGSTNAPYFTGKLTMEDGTELKTALWTNVSAAGVTYYSGTVKPFEPNPAQDPPADPEFIQETIKNWEDRTKADIPDLGRRRLDPPRDVAETNKFWLKSQYMLAKELVHKIEESNLDVVNEEMFAQYKLAQATVRDWEIKHPNELFQPNR